MNVRFAVTALLIACGGQPEFNPPPMTPPPVAPKPDKYAGVCPREPSGTDVPTMKVSIEEAVKRAKALDGQSIRVCGWIHLKFEDTALFPSAAAYTNVDDKNSTSLPVDWLPRSRACEGRYVCVDGVMSVLPPNMIGPARMFHPRNVFDHSD